VSEGRFDEAAEIAQHYFAVLDKASCRGAGGRTPEGATTFPKPRGHADSGVDARSGGTPGAGTPGRNPLALALPLGDNELLVVVAGKRRPL